LIGFAATLRNTETLITELAQRTNTMGQTSLHQRAIALRLSEVCGYAADFYEAVRDIPNADRDQGFIKGLKEARQTMESAKGRSPP
jgi:hypothetical protein